MVERAWNAQLVRMWILCERLLEKNVHDRVRSVNWISFRWATNVRTTGQPSVYNRALVKGSSDILPNELFNVSATLLLSHNPFHKSNVARCVLIIEYF